MVFLRTPPPIYEIAKLRVKGAVQVYALMFESAFKDKQYDIAVRKRKLQWQDLRDTGGRSEWSIKGLSDCLRLGKATVNGAISELLDHGFISFDGYMSTGKGSKKKVYRVTPLCQLEAKRHAIEIMGKPSERQSRQACNANQIGYE